MTTYLAVEQVCAKLERGGVDPQMVSRVFAARLQPQNLDDPDRKFTLALPASGDRAYLVVYQFGLGRPLLKQSPLDEGGPDWRPRWVSVEGPYADCQTEVDPMHPDRRKFTEQATSFLQATSKELTSE